MAKKKAAAAKKAGKKVKKAAQKAAGKGAGAAQSGSASSAPPSMKPGDVCWSELNSTNPALAETFYKKLFGWKTTRSQLPDGVGDYVMLNNGGPLDFGGIMQQMGPGAPAGWLTYFYVKNVDAALKQIESLGGRVLAPATDISMGRIGFAEDPAGAQFAVFALPG